MRKRAARWGLEWTVAEDQFLFRRLRELEADGDREPLIALARELERGRLAIATRLSTLRAGVRLAQDGRKR